MDFDMLIVKKTQKNKTNKTKQNIPLFNVSYISKQRLLTIAL